MSNIQFLILHGQPAPPSPSQAYSAVGEQRTPRGWAHPPPLIASLEPCAQSRLGTPDTSE